MNRDDPQIAGWRAWRFGFGSGEDKPIEKDADEPQAECACKQESCGCGCSVTVVDCVARQTPPFMAGKDSADSNDVVKSDCL